MKIEEQVCSYSQAKRLAELGLRLPTLFHWVPGEKSGDAVPAFLGDQDLPDSVAKEQYPAPTVAELGLLLPTEISLDDEDLYLQGTIGNRRREFYYIWFQSSIDNVEWELFPSIEKETEAVARAEALIWLIENEFVKVENLSC